MNAHPFKCANDRLTAGAERKAATVIRINFQDRGLHIMHEQAKPQRFEDRILFNQLVEERKEHDEAKEVDKVTETACQKWDGFKKYCEGSNKRHDGQDNKDEWRDEGVDFDSGTFTLHKLNHKTC